MKLYLGLALLTTAAARKTPKKFESAKEMTLRDGPRRHEVDAPVRRRRIVTQRVQGSRGAVRRLRGPGRALRADAPLENDRQEGVLPRGEDGVSPFVGVES